MTVEVASVHGKRSTLCARAVSATGRFKITGRAYLSSKQAAGGEQALRLQVTGELTLGQELAEHLRVGKVTLCVSENPGTA